MINALCDRALLIGYTKEQHLITAGIIRQAAREIRGEKIAAQQKSPINWRRWAPSPSLAILVILLLALAHYLVDPLDRFARELNVFNRILAGDIDGSLVAEEPRQNPAATAESASEPFKTASQELSALQLVMERLNNTSSPRPSQSLASVFTELDANETLHAGVDALVSLWNLRLAGEYPDGHDAESLIRYFQKQNLACEHFRPNLEQLLHINLPGLVRLVAGDNKLWMTILRADDDSVTLQTEGNRRITVSQSEFAIYYGREFLAPWNDPAPDAPVLLPGQHGARVRSFKELLHQLGHLDASDINDVYDQKTERVVMAIQAEAGLTADGKAGPQVRLALTSWSGDAPSLRRGTNRMGGNISRRYENSRNRAVAHIWMRPAHTSRDDSIPAGSTVDMHKKTDFYAVAGNKAHVEITPPENLVMALPTEATPEPITTPDNTPGRAREERRLFRLLQEQRAVNNGHEEPAEPGKSSVLMEVRELPEPFAPVSPAHSDAHRYDSVTPPVFGSTPLAPREEGR